MAVVYQNGLTVDTTTGKIYSVGNTVAQVTGQSSAPTQTASSGSNTNANVTIYNGKDSMTVPSFDASYWASQGWSTTPPTQNQTQPQVTPAGKFSNPQNGYIGYNNGVLKWYATAQEANGSGAKNITNYTANTIITPEKYVSVTNGSTTDLVPESSVANLRSGWYVSGTTPTTQVVPTTPTSTGWVDPATGNPTPVGVGTPKSSYDNEIAARNATTPVTPTTPATTATSGDKNIYKKGDKLYYNNGSQYVYIPDSATLRDLVIAKGYKDTRLDLPEATATVDLTTPEEQAAKQKETETQALSDQVNSYIETLDIDESQKAVLRALAKQESTSGTKFYTPSDIERLLLDATTAATADITPYYEKVARQDIDDLKNKMSDIRGQADRYMESDKENYASVLEKTRKALRTSGLTFSGANRKTLGAEGAISSNGVEGTVPTARRLDYNETMAGLTQKAREAGLTAERNLGSSKLSSLTGDLGAISNPYANGNSYNSSGKTSIYTPTGTTQTGEYDLNKKRDIEKSKWSRITSLNQYLQ